MAHLSGRTIQHYAVHERIGFGGMGEVYRATDTRLDRPVALKFLPSSHQFDPERRARLIREARAASALQSPYTVSTFDLGEHEGTAFIVMEFLEGEALSKRLEAGPLPVGDTVTTAMQVAEALEEAHARGIVHRDIKSENLILTRRGTVKVVDFGVAKFVDHSGQDAAESITRTDTGHTLPGLVLGTGSYMSPEQARSDATSITGPISSPWAWCCTRC